MIEFGRAPTLCEHCGPSHILVREDVTPDTLLACLSCSLPIGTAAEVCGHDLFGLPEQFGRVVLVDSEPARHHARA